MDDRRSDDRREIVVVPPPVVDAARLRAFLERDRLWGAYALGDLEPGLFDLCDWAVAAQDGRDVAVGLLFKPLELMGCTLIGEADGIRAILREVLTPERAHFTVLPEHEAVVAALYTLGSVDRMLRMVVDEESFRPRTLALENGPLPNPSPGKGGAESVDEAGFRPRTLTLENGPLPNPSPGKGGAESVDEAGFRPRTLAPSLSQRERGQDRHPSLNGRGDGGEGPVPRRVTLTDLDRLNALYAGGETPDAFAPFQIEQGVFYAIEHEGEFIAAAGTHLVAPGEGVAAVGNVYTAQAWRGQGLAQRCASAVVRECFGRGCRDVVLNVNIANKAAIAAYHKLGFRSHCQFLEVTGVRLPSGPAHETPIL